MQDDIENLSNEVYIHNLKLSHKEPASSDHSVVDFSLEKN
jgi:hypothetical protein